MEAGRSSKFLSVKIRYLSVKIFIFLPVKKKFIPVEKSLNVSVKNPDCPWKMSKMRAWKWFCTREKMAKSAKNGFHAHFWFSRGEKLTLLPSGHCRREHISGFLTFQTVRTKICGKGKLWSITLSCKFYTEWYSGDITFNVNRCFWVKLHYIISYLLTS